MASPKLPPLKPETRLDALDIAIGGAWLSVVFLLAYYEYRKRKRRMFHVEQTGKEYWLARNARVQREALASNEPIFILARRSDGYVLSYGQSIPPTLYSEQYMKGHPKGPALTVEWVKVNPLDPTEHMRLDDTGDWWMTKGW